MVMATVLIYLLYVIDSTIICHVIVAKYSDLGEKNLSIRARMAEISRTFLGFLGGPVVLECETVVMTCDDYLFPPEIFVATVRGQPEDCLFNHTFETTFKNLVRHRKPVSGWH